VPRPGLEFDEWQHGAGRVILAKRGDGKYAATIGGTALSIPRQVGKTFLVGAIVFALCLLNPGLTVIWTAHRLRTAGETFDKMQGMARRAKIKPFVAKIVLGSGEEEIRFRNGSRILFGARERGFGRGFDEVDVLIFDEAQILTENAIDDMVPATNQSRQPSGALMLFMGTPPKPTDPGEVFARMRAEALSGEDEDTGYIEFSADPTFSPSETPAPMAAEDWRQIAKANPSYPKRTPREAILRMRKKLTPESMLREGYGIWDDEDAGPGLDFNRWKTLVDASAERGGGQVFALSTAPDRSWAAVRWPGRARMATCR
jgi:phage terminase large subunit-like protein